MSKDEDKETAAALGCILIILMIPVGVLLNGFVLSQMWSWFIVPLGVRSISIAHALGLTTLVGLLKSHRSSNNDGKGTAEIVFNVFGVTVIVPLLMWVIAYIIFVCM